MVRASVNSTSSLSVRSHRKGRGRSVGCGRHARTFVGSRATAMGPPNGAATTRWSPRSRSSPLVARERAHAGEGEQWDCAMRGRAKCARYRPRLSRTRAWIQRREPFGTCGRPAASSSRPGGTTWRPLAMDAGCGGRLSHGRRRRGRAVERPVACQWSGIGDLSWRGWRLTRAVVRPTRAPHRAEPPLRT